MRGLAEPYQAWEWDIYFVCISGWWESFSFDGFNGTNECGEDGRKMRKESFVCMVRY